MGYPGGIDGKVELGLALDRLSDVHSTARLAPRGSGLSGYLSRGISAERSAGDKAGPYWQLTLDLLQTLSIWWQPSAASTLPVMTPWAIRDRRARYDQGPEMWSAPRDDGYLRDDNSVIKKLPLPLYVIHPGAGPYDDRRPWRGFTACHIWRETIDSGLGGTDPWIYSFMPNLVWLPTPLAALTDYDLRVQCVVQRTSTRLYRSVESSPVQHRIDYAWSRLVVDLEDSEDDELALEASQLAMFDVTPAFVQRRLKSIDEFAKGADDVLRLGAPVGKLFSSRYTAGIPTVAPGHLESFRDALASYAREVRQVISASRAHVDHR